MINVDSWFKLNLCKLYCASKLRNLKAGESRGPSILCVWTTNPVCFISNVFQCGVFRPAAGCAVHFHPRPSVTSYLVNPELIHPIIPSTWHHGCRWPSQATLSGVFEWHSESETLDTEHWRSFQEIPQQCLNEFDKPKLLNELETLIEICLVNFTLLQLKN